MAELTPKQQRFVEEYIKDLNGTQAAIRAGYSPKTANEQAVRLLANVSIKTAIDSELEKLRDAALATAYEVEAYLTAVMRGETKAEVVVIEGVGDGCSKARTMQKAPDERERLDAAKTLAKRHGLIDGKLDLTHQLLPPSFSGEKDLE